MVEPGVILVLIFAFFYHAAHLTDIDGSTFKCDLADTRSFQTHFQTQVVLDQPENAVFGWGDV
jgi:hypothetical protein